MLDGKAEVKAEFIAERQFTPQLLVPLCRGHTRFVPHVREVCEFHVTSSALGASDHVRDEVMQERKPHVGHLFSGKTASRRFQRPSGVLSPLLHLGPGESYGRSSELCGRRAPQHSSRQSSCYWLCAK